MFIKLAVVLCYCAFYGVVALRNKDWTDWTDFKCKNSTDNVGVKVDVKRMGKTSCFQHCCTADASATRYAVDIKLKRLLQLWGDRGERRCLCTELKEKQSFPCVYRSSGELLGNNDYKYSKRKCNSKKGSPKTPEDLLSEDRKSKSQKQEPIMDPLAVRTTVIQIKKNTSNDQYLFIRGGSILSDAVSHITGCAEDAKAPFKCAIPITHADTDPDYIITPSDAYKSWSNGDLYLDRLIFTEESQGLGPFSMRALGTPLDKSENGLWRTDLDMDCSKTTNGWFEVSAVLGMQTVDFISNNKYLESELEPQFKSGVCNGTVDADVSNFVSRPMKTHLARCGHINTFSWGTGEDCIIKPYAWESFEHK